MTRPVAALCRLHDALSDAGYVVGTVALGAMTAIYCYEVLTRYFLDLATDWANDTFANVLCIAIFSMVPHATRRAQHVSITLVIEIAPRLRPALKAFSCVFGFVMCAFAAWMSYEENLRQIVQEVVTEQNHPIPKWWMSVWITFGFLGAAFYFLRALFDREWVRPVSWITPGARRADGAG